MAESPTESKAKFERLSDRNNYTSWAKAFKRVAVRDNVWGHFVENKLVEKPDIDEFVSDTGKFTPVQLHIALQKYEIAESAFEEHTKKQRKAIPLLYTHVDDSIQAELDLSNAKPAVAWRWIKDRFLIDNAEVINMLIMKWDDTRFDNNETMQTYINIHKEHYQQLIDLNVSIPEVLVIGKSLNGLPKRFTRWMDR